MDYSLVYRISAKVRDAVEGFARVQKSFGNVGEKMGIMSRRMEKTLTLQKLGWIGFAYVVSKSIYNILLKSKVLQSFLSAWGTMFGALLDIILTPLIPAFMYLTDKLMKVFNWFEKLPGSVKTVIGAFSLIAAIIAIVVPIILTLMPAFKMIAGVLGFGAIKGAIAGAIGAIGTFLTAIGPVGWAILALILAITIFATAWKTNWGDIQGKTQKVIDWFKKYDWVLLFIPIYGALLFVQKKIYENWDKIQSTTKQIWDKITNALQKTWGAIVILATNVWKTIKLVISATLLIIRGVLTGDTELLKKIWSKFGDRIREIWSNVWNKAIQIFTDTSGKLINKVITTKDKIILYFSELPTKLTEFFRNAPQKIADFFKVLPQKIVSAIGDIGQFIWDKLRTSLTWLDDKIFGWARGEIGLSPPLKQIGVFLKNTIENSFLKNAIKIMPKINDTALFTALVNTKEKTRRILNNIQADVGFTKRIPTNAEKIIIDKRTYTITIPIELPIITKEEDKSIEEVANEVATILSSKLKAIM